MPEPTVRFGLVGIGRIATNSIAPAIRKLRRATLAAAASRDRARAAAVGAAVVHDSYEAVIRDPTIDAVYIATHNGLHRPLAIEALQNGKHVFCEKPLGLNASECSEIIAAAKTAKRQLIEGFMYRYHPQISTLQRLIAERTIGDLKVVEASFRFVMSDSTDIRLHQEWGGGALLDVGCYCVNASRLFLGEDVEAVRVSPVFDPVHRIDASVQGVLRFSDNRLATISCGFESGLHQRLTLIGTRGVITLNEPFIEWTGNPTLTIQVGRHEQVMQMPRVNTYEAELEDFVAAILDDRTPLLQPDEGLLNARILDRLAISMKEFDSKHT